MDRVFLDANVLFSVAYASPGLARLWQRAADGHCALLTSAYAVDEARRNLAAPHHRAALDRRLATVELVAEGPPDTPCPLALPEKDLPIWSAAVASRATPVTGDVQHFGAHLGRTVQGVCILRPAAYLASAGAALG